MNLLMYISPNSPLISYCSRDCATGKFPNRLVSFLLATCFSISLFEHPILPSTLLHRQYAKSDLRKETGRPKCSPRHRSRCISSLDAVAQDAVGLLRSTLQVLGAVAEKCFGDAHAPPVSGPGAARGAGWLRPASRVGVCRRVEGVFSGF